MQAWFVKIIGGAAIAASLAVPAYASLRHVSADTDVATNASATADTSVGAQDAVRAGANADASLDLSL